MLLPQCAGSLVLGCPCWHHRALQLGTPPHQLLGTCCTELHPAFLVMSRHWLSYSHNNMHELSCYHTTTTTLCVHQPPLLMMSRHWLSYWHNNMHELSCYHTTTTTLCLHQPPLLLKQRSQTPDKQQACTLNKMSDRSLSQFRTWDITYSLCGTTALEELWPPSNECFFI